MRSMQLKELKERQIKSKYLAGIGIARQRQAIVDLSPSALVFSENVSRTCAKNIMDMNMVLVTPYFGIMKEIGAPSKSTSVFIPHGPGAVKDVASHIQQGLLNA